MIRFIPLLFIFLIPMAYGYEYEEKRILESPTVCAIPPDDPLIPSQVKKSYLKETKDAVLEWQYMLQVEAKKPANWKINYLEGDYNTCTITIEFKKHFDEDIIPDYYGIAGLYKNETIEIYFIDYSTCGIGEEVWCENDIATGREVSIIVKHEFGHALGLGHTTEEKSIMNPASNMINDYNKIGENDIKAVQRIYGIDGFNSYKGELASWIVQSAKEYSRDIITGPDYLDSVRHLVNIEKIHVKQNMTNNKEQLPSWFKNNAGWWASEKITDADYLNSIEYLLNKGIMKI